MTSPQISVRPAQKSDILSMTGLLSELFSLEEDFQVEPSRQSRGLEQLLESDSAVVLVADLNGNAVGMCVGQILVSTAEGGPALLVEDVVVANQFKRRGIGSSLLATLTEEASRRGVSRLQLLADRNNSAALNFYRKTGWRSTELICLRSRVPGKKVLT